MKIKQGYPEKVIGNLDKTKSGWFLYLEKDCEMIHEKTINEIKKIIDKLKSTEVKT